MKHTTKTFTNSEAATKFIKECQCKGNRVVGCYEAYNYAEQTTMYVVHVDIKE